MFILGAEWLCREFVGKSSVVLLLVSSDEVRVRLFRGSRSFVFGVVVVGFSFLVGVRFCFRFLWVVRN